jgi:hypothetical protein
MTDSLPAHLADAIRRRIAALRAASQVDESYLDPSPRLRGYPLVREHRQERPDLS